MTYTITTNHSDDTEPNENAKEADVLDLGSVGATVTQRLNSPIDNDWYKFTVEGGPAQEKIWFTVSSIAGTNGYKFELYRNLVAQNYYGMQFLGYGTNGQVELPAVNAHITGKVIDEQWKAMNRPDMAIVYGDAVTNDAGSYAVNFYLNSPLGGLSSAAPISTHYYDLMTVNVWPEGNEDITAVDEFYYLKYSLRN